MVGEVRVTWTQVAPSGPVAGDKDSITCLRLLATLLACIEQFLTNDIYHLLLCKECVLPISLKP